MLPRWNSEIFSQNRKTKNAALWMKFSPTECEKNDRSVTIACAEWFGGPAQNSFFFYRNTRTYGKDTHFTVARW